jgi:hypothetical protein
MRRSTFLAPVAALALIAPMGVAAQEENTGTGAGRFPLEADPAACIAEPRDRDQLLELWFDESDAPAATPMPADGSMGESGAMELSVPVGPPADAATQAALADTVRHVFSCFAAGDALRAFALFTDDLAVTFGPEPGVTREDAASYLEPMTPESADEQSAIVAIAGAMELPDGRVGAFVVDETGGEQTVVYAIFEEQDGTWRVDELIDFAVAHEGADDSGDAGGSGDAESAATPAS